jgi:hypothetical protein
MREVTGCSRVEQLKALLLIVADEIDNRPGARDLAGLAKQYRELTKEIEEIEGGESEDEIADILNSRNADGKSRTVRPNRS